VSFEVRENPRDYQFDQRLNLHKIKELTSFYTLFDIKQITFKGILIYTLTMFLFEQTHSKSHENFKKITQMI
jgi:hypothetical protein